MSKSHLVGFIAFFMIQFYAPLGSVALKVKKNEKRIGKNLEGILRGLILGVILALTWKTEVNHDTLSE
jgi:uncharacterized membrane protein YkvI